MNTYSPEVVARMQDTLSKHADDPRHNRCRHCGYSRCSLWSSARAELMIAGVIPTPPLRATGRAQVPAGVR